MDSTKKPVQLGFRCGFVQVIASKFYFERTNVPLRLVTAGDFSIGKCVGPFYAGQSQNDATQGTASFADCRYGATENLVGHAQQKTKL
jgi:hypothetical protein